ncbi:dTMP kinase [Rickettsia typhi]|uniref:Thymidylate kinase n=2 Tax=Rickettsia typhi TaxID=785 RepID=KTHY_RICTY|nr:dTMP kinase [Rickettsia typhi]Q68W53.1 RecName: Full=Thymidylate kinase; AltName: Full=dTMP kinase [Rickettsia typhi str. Wilmington]AAU04139.1 TMPK [Rickettsia typhi str. Wilmington]AFE54516.1 thymidylate kinase [Rickettsia typhi str. TH1527]AFE55355.1 thymidylate kinase [Rickettsia typhi str. B9991CWPP]
MNKLTQGKFITFEGMDGIGKSTQSKMLYEYLKSQKIPVILTREVGGTFVAEKMREILVHEELLPMSELLQAMAARYDHMVRKIIPALKDGYIVICDRFIDSTACYQGLELENGIDLVYSLHTTLMPSLMPDITFFIDVEPDTAIKRVNSRNMSNKFDRRRIDFYKKIYSCFQELSHRFPERIKTIKASHLNPLEVHELIQKHL